CSCRPSPANPDRNPRRPFARAPKLPVPDIPTADTIETSSDVSKLFGVLERSCLLLLRFQAMLFVKVSAGTKRCDRHRRRDPNKRPSGNPSNAFLKTAIPGAHC